MERLFTLAHRDNRDGIGAVAEDEPFLLAVLNRDGLAQPFAAFDGRRWKAPWPDRRQTELPISLGSVDSAWWGIGALPSRMTLWAHGSAVAEASITALAAVPRLMLGADRSAHRLPIESARTAQNEGALSKGRSARRRDRTGRPHRDGRAGIRGVEPRPDSADRWLQQGRVARDRLVWRLAASGPRGVTAASGDHHRSDLQGAERRPGWTTYFVEAVREYQPTSFVPTGPRGLRARTIAA